MILEAESPLAIPIRDLSLVPHDDRDAAISLVSGHNLKITGLGSGALVLLALRAGLVSDRPIPVRYSSIATWNSSAVAMRSEGFAASALVQSASRTSGTSFRIDLGAGMSSARSLSKIYSSPNPS